jgi:alcohol dehydrogenase class IV
MWFYYAPTVIYGQDALDHLEKVSSSLEKKSAFIVTDPGIIEVGLIEILTDKLKELSYDFIIFGEVEPDPSEETILKAAKLCNDSEPDLIVALGGGSAIDTAKGVWVLYERPDLTIDDIHPFETLNLGKKSQFVAIPTTAGTGAECTGAVIVTRTQEGVQMKLEQTNPETIPLVAILDPRFVKTLPPKLTAMTAFDAVGHAIEAIISEWRNDFSNYLSIGAYDLIRKYLPIAYTNGDNMVAREKLQNAAAMAGMSFGNSQVMLAHTLAHVLGAALHIPHGLGVGLYLPYVLQYCMNDPDTGTESASILSKFAKMLEITTWDKDDRGAADLLIEDIKKLQDKVNFPRSLKQILEESGITKDQLDDKMDIMTQQCLESAVASMSPRSAGIDDYKKIIKYVYEGRDIDF